MSALPTYNEMLRTINGDQENAYTELLSKDAKTLEVVNNVVNHEANKKAFYKAFFNMPLSAIFSDFTDTITQLVNQLSTAQTAGDYAVIFKENKTLFYVGAAVIILAVLILLIEGV